MAIVQELNETWFIERFKEMGRGEQFSLTALEKLYEYYDNLSDDMGEDVKLDVIAICCDWYELNWKEISEQYNLGETLGLSGIETNEERKKAVIEYLENETTVIDCDETILYMAF